eukprot:3286234-Amphidinium_carterae.1
MTIATKTIARQVLCECFQRCLAVVHILNAYVLEGSEGSSTTCCDHSNNEKNNNNNNDNINNNNNNNKLSYVLTC